MEENLQEGTAQVSEAATENSVTENGPKKLKNYSITIPRVFPAGHPKKGEKTYLVQKILAQCKDEFGAILPAKIHAILPNYGQWKKRIEEVVAEKAELSLNFANGDQAVTIRILNHKDNIGIQPLKINKDTSTAVVDSAEVEMPLLAANEGFSSAEDLMEMLSGFDLNKTHAIIHFTKFRYQVLS